MKRIYAVLLAALLLTGLGGVAQAEDTVYDDGFFYYTVEDGSITIVGYFGTETEVTVPASIANTPVNAVAPDAFIGTSVTKLYLPDTVTDYQGSGGITVVFNANTDHPYTAEELLEEIDTAPAEEDSGSDVFDSVSVTETVPQQNGESTPTEAADEDESPMPRADGEVPDGETVPTDEEESENQRHDFRMIALIVGGAAVAAAAILGFRKKKLEQTNTEKDNQDKE